MTFRPQTFDSSDFENWKTHLDREGYVVIRDILPKESMDSYMELFKTEWNIISPRFSWEDKKTWNIENSPMMFGKGMAVFNGFGHSNFMWSLRTDPNIYGIFEQFHYTDELVTSLDGFSVFLSNKQKTKSWLHIDQNPCNKIYSIQGSYNFKPVGEDDAGFVVVPKSHISFTPAVSHKRDWIPVDQDTFQPQSVKLLIPENCLVLWNSKTIHASTGMTKKDVELNRLTAYITFLPKYLRNKDIKLKRISSYMNGKTTSHWANKCEVKTYPFGFKTNYENKNFKEISPKLEEDGSIPVERLQFI